MQKKAKDGWIHMGVVFALHSLQKQSSLMNYTEGFANNVHVLSLVVNFNFIHNRQ